MRGWPKTPEVAMIAFTNADDQPANISSYIANMELSSANMQVNGGITQSARRYCRSAAVPTRTPWGGTLTCVDRSPKGS